MWLKVSAKVLKCLGLYEPLDADVATFGQRIGINKLPRRYLLGLYLLLPFIEKLIVNKGKIEWETMFEEFEGD
jgi:hypothetical protein